MIICGIVFFAILRIILVFNLLFDYFLVFRK